MRPLAFFVLLAFLISWAIAIPLALSSRGLLPWTLHPALHLLIPIGPILAASLVVARTGGSVRDFFGRVVRLRPHRWLVLAPLAAVAAYALAAVIATGGRAMGAAPPATLASWPTFAVLPFGLAYALTFGLGEQAGWRGFALERLERRCGRLGATLALYGIVLAWHIPLMLDLDAIGKGGAWGMGRAAVGILAGTFLLNAMYRHSGGSVVACALFHGFLNGVSTVVDDPLTTSLATIVLAGAALVVARARSAPPEAAPHATLPLTPGEGS